ncbi:DsbA family oxidoreductase [Kurthia sibirica]|uniref:Disulfide bond formation protein DsbA n=1 Tax=Kurthia sibirica TaxID=202750 RepID=A0A2U3AK73_9BACL|nr:DsbA family oxidoreductase [Kurthia sibirica]PWI24932.1 disulfide bond formation protein DsbA [Kurthia sibirica]GEK33157.1 DSBA oxidoreductase [Kurthia sibirica]
MKIQVWSDYVCPFCYIGKRELENALATTGFKDQVEVEYMAYQLDPGTPADSDETVYSMLSKKYGMSEEQAQAQTQGIKQRAASVGLNYDFDKMASANTFKAHRLAKYAATIGKEQQVTERLLKGYFEEGQKIGQDAVLIALAAEVGISEDEVKNVLADDTFATDVLADIAQARELGVQGVPFFVIDNKYAISGAQPAQVFEETVTKAAEEAGIHPALKMMGNGNAGVCTDDSCEI